MLSESEMVDHLRQELNNLTQVFDMLVEMLRGLYTSGDLSPESEETIEDLFRELDLDL